MNGYLSKKTKLIFLRRSGGYVWRLMDLFSSVLDSGTSSTQADAILAARPARARYEDDVNKKIEARKAKIVASFKENEWPPNWKKRVMEFQKLNALRKAREEERKSND